MKMQTGCLKTKQSIFFSLPIENSFFAIMFQTFYMHKYFGSFLQKMSTV